MLALSLPRFTNKKKPELALRLKSPGWNNRSGIGLAQHLIVFDHAHAIKRFVDALVAGCAIDFRNIARRSESLFREDRLERTEIGLIHVTDHMDTMPCGHALWTAFFP